MRKFHIGIGTNEKITDSLSLINSGLHKTPEKIPRTIQKTFSNILNLISNFCKNVLLSFDTLEVNKRLLLLG